LCNCTSVLIPPVPLHSFCSSADSPAVRCPYHHCSRIRYVFLSPLAFVPSPIVRRYVYSLRVGEAPGEGALGTYISSKIKALIPGPSCPPPVGVPYPATFEDYIESESRGAWSMKGMVDEYGKFLALLVAHPLVGLLLDLPLVCCARSCGVQLSHVLDQRSF
jgi:hypothetical protein